MVDINQRQKDKFALLQAMYHECDGHINRYVSYIHVGRAIGFEEHYARQLAWQLKEYGLIEHLTQGEHATLTALGISEIEDAEMKPSAPTQYFSPQHFTIYSEQVAIVQGTGNSVVQVQNTEQLRGNLKRILDEIKEDIHSVSEDKSKQTEILEEIGVLLSEIVDNTAKPTLLKQLAKGLGRLLQSVGTAGAIRYAEQLLDLQ